MNELVHMYIVRFACYFLCAISAIASTLLAKSVAKESSQEMASVDK